MKVKVKWDWGEDGDGGRFRCAGIYVRCGVCVRSGCKSTTAMAMAMAMWVWMDLWIEV